MALPGRADRKVSSLANKVRVPFPAISSNRLNNASTTTTALCSVPRIFSLHTRQLRPQFHDICPVLSSTLTQWAGSTAPTPPPAFTAPPPTLSANPTPTTPPPPPTAPTTTAPRPAPTPTPHEKTPTPVPNTPSPAPTSPPRAPPPQHEAGAAAGAEAAPPPAHALAQAISTK